MAFISDVPNSLSTDDMKSLIEASSRDLTKDRSTSTLSKTAKSSRSKNKVLPVAAAIAADVVTKVFENLSTETGPGKRQIDVNVKNIFPRSRRNGDGGDGSGSDGNGNGGNGRSRGRRKKEFREGDIYRYPAPSRSSRVEWNSGVSSGTIVHVKAEKNSNFSSLFVQNGEFLPKVDIAGDTMLSKYINDDIYYRYLRTAFDKSNYKIDKVFTKEAFFKYMYTLSEALQLYYMVDSIDTYFLNPDNKNNGMTHLYNRLSPSVRGKHAALRTALIGLPIPPNLLNFIRFMYQNFSFSPHADSPIIRLGFRQTLITLQNPQTDGLDDDTYNMIIGDINNNIELTSVFNKVFADYKTEDLPPSSSDVIYSEQFLNFWYNSDIAYVDTKTGLKHSRSASSLDESMHYGQFTEEEVDAVIYACVSASHKDSIEPGLWAPITHWGDNATRASKTSLYCYDDRDQAVVACWELGTRIASGVFSAPVFNGDPNVANFYRVIGCHPGVRCVLAHNLNLVEQSVARTVEHLFYPYNQG